MIFAALSQESPFDNGIAETSLNGTSQIINKTGKIISPEGCRLTERFSGGIIGITLATGQMALMDKTGKVLTPYKYDPYCMDCGDFQGSLLRVKDAGLYGLIDKTGKEIVAPQYDKLLDFSEGLAAYLLEDTACGFIDKTGKRVFNDTYHMVESFESGLALVSRNDLGEGVIDKTGKLILPLKYSSVRILEGGLIIAKGEDESADLRIYLYDKTGKRLANRSYIEVGEFVEKCAIVYRDDLYGFINSTGKEICAPKYAQVSDFSNGMALVVNGEGLYGAIDQTDKEIIAPQYDGMVDFEKGLAQIWKGEKTGVINKSGKVIVPTEYDMVFLKDDSLIAVNVDGQVMGDKIDGGKYGLYDLKGTQILKHEYDKFGNFEEGLICVLKDSKLGFADRTGKIVVPFEYDFIIYGRFFEGLAAANKGGFMKGSEGFVAGKWGYINPKGQVVIPFDFSEVSVFHNSVATVCVDTKCGLIDKTGKSIVPMEYQGIGSMNEGLALMKQNDKFGVIDAKGQVVVAAKYQNMGDFMDGYAPFQEDFRCGFIDKTGKVVIPAQFDNVEGGFIDGIAKVTQGSDIYYVNKKGEIIR